MRIVFLELCIVIFNSIYFITMSDSPVSDLEKHAYSSDNKVLDKDDKAVYMDEALGESDVVEFVETKDLR